MLYSFGMTKTRKWTEAQLVDAAKVATSIRQIIFALGLEPAGGNYAQIKKYLKEFKVDISHFKGKSWNKGMKGIGSPRIPLESILVKGSQYQSFKLKKRLFSVNLKSPVCELCMWSKSAPDGRIPLELDHINGDRTDNRLENLRVLCPNCHSLQPTHRGLNRRKK